MLLTDCQRSDNASVQEQIIRLAVVFKDREALSKLRAIANDPTSPADDRAQTPRSMHWLANELQVSMPIYWPYYETIRCDRLRCVASLRTSLPKRPRRFLSQYATMNASDRQDAQLTLASRKSWAKSLLGAIEAKQIDANELTAYSVRQIRSLGDDDLNATLANHWGGLRETSKDKAKQIRSIKKWLSTKKLDQADMVRGRAAV